MSDEQTQTTPEETAQRPEPAKPLAERHAEWLRLNNATIGVRFQLLDGTLVDPANFLSHIPGQLVYGPAPLQPE